VKAVVAEAVVGAAAVAVVMAEVEAEAAEAVVGAVEVVVVAEAAEAVGVTNRI
jgi:hypothetical protein